MDSKDPKDRPVADAARPDTFTDAASWELELLSAHVIVTALPQRAGYDPITLPPPRLRRYRYSVAGALPSANYGARAGGWLELATLYLLRDKSAPLDAELFIRQRVFTAQWAIIVQPGADIPALIQPVTLNVQTGLPMADAFIGAADATAQALADATRAELERDGEGFSDAMYRLLADWTLDVQLRRSTT